MLKKKVLSFHFKEKGKELEIEKNYLLVTEEEKN